jgi:hypothetical protein
MNGILENQKLEFVQNATALTGIKTERISRKGYNFYVYIYLDPRKPGNFKYNEYEFNHEPFYVGKGKNKRAWLLKRHPDKMLQRKLNKFTPIILLTKNKFSEVLALKIESALISKIGRSDLKEGPLANLTNGGEGTSGYIMTEDHKNKIIKSRKGYKHSEETKRKIGESNKGKIISEEQKKNQSNKMKGRQSRLGKHHTEETKNKLSVINTGKKHTELSRKKMSDVKMGHYVSEETKVKLSKVLKGRVFSEEWKRKISESKKRKALCT